MPTIRVRRYIDGESLIDAKFSILEVMGAQIACELEASSLRPEFKPDHAYELCVTLRELNAQERPAMPTNTHYTDEQVATWIAEKYPMRGHRTGEMLRALLADRRRAEAHRAALLAEVRAWRAAIENGQVADEGFFYAVNIEYLDEDRIDAARRATDALLGAEVQ